MLCLEAKLIAGTLNEPVLIETSSVKNNENIY